MKLSKKTFTCVLLSSLLPATAFADITFTNHSSSEMTFFAKHFCSSLADKGIIQPRGGSYTLPHDIIKNNCYSSCTVEVFASANCETSKKIGTAVISAKQGGVVGNSIVTMNTNYIIEGSGSYAAIRDANTGVNSWFKSFFG